jgi:16S rRNA (cytidine1402-2'-O)-methyltransferase
MPEKVQQIGVLYVVATPIGNLDDISRRAVTTLADADLILAEDTRHSQRLLSHLGLRKPMQSLHQHNEAAQTEKLLARLQAGEHLALISDAGTPLISDPGFPLVRAACEAGYRIIPIPGPSALITALSVSGLPCDRFVFEGFLPAKSKARISSLQALKKETRTLVFYESPHRIRDSLAAMGEVLGSERQAVVARELTKTFEQIESGTLSSLFHWLEADEHHSRGEFVVMVAGTETAAENELIDSEQLLTALLEELPLSSAVKLTSRITGKPRNELYQRALEKNPQKQDVPEALSKDTQQGNNK